jgi:hypothetical protein
MTKQQWTYPANATLEQYLFDHILWSGITFGEGPRTEGLLKHIAKECLEVHQAIPDNLEEWVDIIILAIDGATRSVYKDDPLKAAQTVAWYLRRKLEKNEKRKWPPLGQKSQDEPIEHIKEGKSK